MDPDKALANNSNLSFRVKREICSEYVQQISPYGRNNNRSDCLISIPRNFHPCPCDARTGHPGQRS